MASRPSSPTRIRGPIPAPTAPADPSPGASPTGGSLRVDAVILDYGGVVRREDPADFDAFARDSGLQPGILWAAFHDIPEYELSRTGRLDAAGYRSAVVRALAPALDAPAARRALATFDDLRRADAPVEPEIDVLLDALRPVVRLGLLSNAGSGARVHLESLGVAARFHDVVTSGDVGLAKPDPRIFRLAAHRLAVAPARCLFVDDTLRHVEGAREIGMHAHHHHRSRHAELLAVLCALGLPVGEPA